MVCEVRREGVRVREIAPPRIACRFLEYDLYEDARCRKCDVVVVKSG
jgi:hypothetical protein